MWVIFSYLAKIENCQLVAAGLEPGSSESPCLHTDHSATSSLLASFDIYTSITIFSDKVGLADPLEARRPAQVHLPG